MRTLRLKNVIYFTNFNICGGVETFCYEMGLKYGKDFDITVMYKNGDPAMLAHIAEVARVIKYRPGDKVVCDTFIFGYGWEPDMFEVLEAKEIIQTFHADYVCRHLNPCPDKRITHRFGVADNTTKGIREHYPWAADIETMYNPYTPKKPRKVLRLISATRLSAEKGMNRMIAFADALDKKKVPFHWEIYTDIHREFPNKSVAVMPSRLDVLDFIAAADYLVQLSDTEGYSYSIVEALSVGTPVICAEIPVAQENGVIDGKTGFILPFDMSRIPIKQICKGLKKFEYKPRESHYEQYLVKGKAQFEDDKGGNCEIRCKKRYFDIELNDYQMPGDKQTVTWERADKLVQLGVVEVI